MRYDVTFSAALAIDLDVHAPGEELALWLQTELCSEGESLDVIDCYRDVAWSLESSEPRAPWLIVGHVGDPEAEWMLQVRSSIGWIGRLLGRGDTDRTNQLVRAVHRVLTTDSRFADIWWHEGDFVEGTPSPEPEPGQFSPGQNWPASFGRD